MSAVSSRPTVNLIVAQEGCAHPSTWIGSVMRYRGKIENLFFVQTTLKASQQRGSPAGFRLRNAAGMTGHVKSCDSPRSASTPIVPCTIYVETILAELGRRPGSHGSRSPLQCHAGLPGGGLPLRHAVFEENTPSGHAPLWSRPCCFAPLRNRFPPLRLQPEDRSSIVEQNGLSVV